MFSGTFGTNCADSEAGSEPARAAAIASETMGLYASCASAGATSVRSAAATNCWSFRHRRSSGTAITEPVVFRNRTVD